MSASEPGPTASNTIQTLGEDPPFIKFPPFPEPPPGATIMPFKDFKPRGIQLFAEPKKCGDSAADEEDVELDALGIPTVELRIKHATDECKSNSRKKRKKKKAPVVEAVPVKKLAWYDEWEEGEDLRVSRMGFDPKISPVDRFYQSAYDFRTGRPWPSVSSGLNNLWDQFRLFTGLLVNPSVFRKRDGKTSTGAESPDFGSDDDDDDDPAMDVKDSAAAGGSRPAKRQRSGEALDLDDEDNDPRKMDEELREEKLSIFLNDPEKEMRIFLSSYMREHGLIWTERNLTHIPRLVSFFLTFVLRNRVLPEPVYQRGLKRALDTIEKAKKELPLTYKVGQSIPDAFNEACRECFGRQGGINWSIVNARTETEQQNASITVTDMSSGAKKNVALPSEVQIQLKDAIEDNVDMDVSVDTSATLVSPTNDDVTNSTPTGWEAAWDNMCGDGEPLNAWAQSGSWANELQDGQGTNGDAENKWTSADPSWHREFAALISLLGPSAFPLTHTTGVVECSTRRVSAVYFPSGHPRGVPPRHLELGRARAHGREKEWAPSANDVEAELEERFAKVILEPWGREEGDISGPEIGSASRGPAIDPTNPSKILGDPTGTATRKPHDPRKDNITLLVHPSFAETLELVPGLGLGAMWIEIVRQERGSGGYSAVEPAPVDTSIPGRFWYHEDVTGIFPSFYTPQPKA